MWKLESGSGGCYTGKLSVETWERYSGGCYTGKLSVETREQYWGLLYRETQCGNLGEVLGAVIPGN